MKAYVTGCITMLLHQGNTSVANCVTCMPCGGLMFLPSAILLCFLTKVARRNKLVFMNGVC